MEDNIMGWISLLDEQDREIGIVGDQAWDCAGDFIDEINLMYNLVLGRNVKRIEIESILDFVWNGKVE